MIASRMRQLRKSLGLSMPAFGKKLGCSRDVIANIEYGRSKPKEVFLNHLCDIYGVNRQWLISGIGPMFDEKAGDEKVREAAELFRSLSSDLRELALSQMKSLQKLMIKNEARQTGVENIDTIRLMVTMLDAQEYSDVKAQTDAKITVGLRILELMDERNLSFGSIAKAATLDEKELQNILDSQQSVRRDALIAVSIALSLDLEETQRLLNAAGLPSLYSKNRKDAACIFALMKGLGVTELNELLMGLEEQTL